MDPEMIVIGDVTSQGAIPSMESGSANEASTYYPTKKQIESNNLNRFIENASNIGSGASVAYATTVFASDTSSEGVTATIQVGNAIGNLLGLIVGPLVHLFARKYYRTGEYNVKVGAARPKEEVISEMPKGEVLIYQDQEKLHYLVKGVGKSVVEGEIEEAELGLIFCDELYKLSSGLKRNSTLLLAPKSKLAFLKYTAKKGHTYSGKTSLNPLYRTYRTLSKAGGQAGVIISYFLSGEDRNKQRLISYILSNAIAVFCGCAWG